MTETEIAKILTLIAKIHPKTVEGLTAEKIRERNEYWAFLLGDISYKQAENATIKVLRNIRYVPTPADVIAAVREQSSEMPAELAWIEVQQKLDPYITPKWSSDLISQAVKVLGFRALCESEKPSIDRAQFIKTYNNLLERQHIYRENEVVLSLTGGKLQIKGANK